uniref:Uncharacterized protein n=1 Tax=viral metagenome TaxID=1070528 RepID=A0A6C0CST3_9ZZZZ
MFYKYWNYALLFLFVVAFIGFYLKSKYYEAFEEDYPGYNTTIQYANMSPDIRDRHPIHSVLTNQLNLRYKKAYNYELENNAYTDALKKTFKLMKKCIPTQDYTEEQPLNRTLPVSIEDAYKLTVSYIDQNIKSSSHFDLPDGSVQVVNPIQIVHDRLISYQIHKTIPNDYLLTIDFILYRDGKYHGKHVRSVSHVQKNKGWTINVLDIWVKGVIFEDQIALFPVVGNDINNTNVDLSAAEFTGAKYSNYIQTVEQPEYTAAQLRDMEKAGVDTIRTTPLYLQ